MSRRCTYAHPKFEDGRCPRTATPGWTTCGFHHTAGKSTKRLRPKRKGPR